MGIYENPVEPACSSSRMVMADEVEVLVGSPVGGRLVEWVVKPLSSLDIGSQAPLKGGNYSGLQFISEKHDCSVSNHGLGPLEAEDRNTMEPSSMPLDGDTNFEGMADFGSGHADINPDVGNVPNIELGLSRICFDETQCKSERNPCSRNQMDSLDEGQLPSEVPQVASAPSDSTAQNETNHTADGDNPSLKGPVEVVSNNTFAGAVDDRSKRSLLMADEFRLKGVVTDATESSGTVEKEGKDDVSTVNVTCQFKCPDARSLSLRRSMRTKKSFHKAQGGKHEACKKKSSKLSLGGTVDLLSKATRKKRSCLSRSSCGWGLSGNLSKYFQWSNGFIVDDVLKKEPKKGKAGQKSRKKNVLKVVASSKTSEAKQEVPCRPIRLKVTFGKKEKQNKEEGMPPVGIDALSSLPHGNDGNQAELFSVLTEMPLLKRCNNPVENMLFPGTDLEICSTLGKSSHADCIPLEPEKLVGLHAEKYLDPGTSPDSEVIDQVLDSTVGTRISTVVHKPENIISTCADPGNVSSLPFPLKKSKKKRNKRDKVCQADNPGMEDKLLCQASSNKAKESKKGGQKQEKSDGFCSTDAGITAPSENPSSNTSCSELISMEFLSVSDEGPHKALSLENGADSNICSGIGVGVESADTGNSCQMLPPDKIKVNRNSEGSKAKGKSRNKSKITDATRNRKETLGQPKVNKRKLTSKCKLDKNDILDKVQNKGGQSETEHNVAGKFVVVDVAKADPSQGLAPENLSCQAVRPIEVVEQMLPPRIAWVCCDDCLKWRCISAELADVIEETNSRWTCKDNQDQAFADCSIPQEKSNAEINAELQISEEEDPCDGHLGSKANGIKHAAASQPSTWMLITSNLFLHRSRKTQTMDEIMVCHCKPSADGGLGCGSQCLNRMLNIECVQGTCPCGDLCSNQQFQKRQYAKLSWFRCGKKGFGLQVLEDISKEQFLIEYVGEVLDLQAYEARQKMYASKGHKHFYFMTLNGNEVIDACTKGNLGRFVNHSCDPNCRTEKWIVNGKICVGLFALRNIRKGEELTFDYNYVRIFGAAAKKCHCGSSKCRGFIGGDPLNADVVVQGDSDEEFPEPVVVNENGEIDHTLENMVARIKSEDIELGPNANNLCEEKLKDVLGGEKMATKMEKSPIDVGGRSPTFTEKESPTFTEKEPVDEVHESSANLVTLKTEDVKNEAVSAAKPLTLTTEQPISTSTSSPISDVLPEKEMDKKSLSGSIDSNGRMSEVDILECERPPSKPWPRMKISRPFKSVKNRKPDSNSASAEKALAMVHRCQVLSHKPKKLLEGSANGHLEAVEEKLNELLDADGGIYKRKDASKGYLKLLFLTAASGDSCNGGAIQSNRDLSMILDAILKTKSRGLLLDIINKNGLQMLHNMMKLYRKDFKKIPILRKLLKVFEFLAEREVLNVERINGDPLHPGMESFRESILSLTEHEDKKVHQIARNFRDRWIRRTMRKVNRMEKSDQMRESNRSSNFNRFFGTHHRWRDHGVRPTEPINCSNQLETLKNPADTRMQEASSPQICSLTVICRPRKRKSRWDQPANMVSPKHRKEQKIELNSPKTEITEEWVSQTTASMDETTPNFSEIHKKGDDMDDAPPGFSSPHNSEDAPLGFSSLPKSEDAPPGFSSLSPQNSSPLKCPSGVSTGHLQERFNSHLPVAYGIPFSVMHQFGTLQSGTVDSWVIAPSMPFQPFPPLPPYPRDKRDSPQSATNGGHEVMKVDNCLQGDSFWDQGIPSTSGASMGNVRNAGTANPHMVHHERGFWNGPGRRHYRQRKWNPFDQRAPWVRNRFGWGFKGNHPRNGVFSSNMETIANEMNGQHLADVNHSVEYANNSR